MKTPILALGTCLCACAWMQASVIVSPGNNPQQPGEENVLLNGANSGDTVFGSTNVSNLEVSFVSDVPIVANPNGQSFITGAGAGAGVNGGPFTSMTVSLPSGTFTDLIFALDAFGKGNATDTVTFSAATSDGLGVTSGTTGVVGPGTTFFTALASGSSTISSFTITSATAGGLQDIRQVRISGETGGVPGGGGGGQGGPGTVPEPASYLLLGSGLTLVGWAGRKSRRA